MTLIDVTFYAAPLMGLILFLCGYHLGGSRRTKEHSACVKEVGRLYDKVRHLRKELADFELKQSQTQDQVGRLQRQLDFERTTSAAKSEVLTSLEEELEEVKERLSILSRQYNKLLRSHLRNGGTTIS